MLNIYDLRDGYRNVGDSVIEGLSFPDLLALRATCTDYMKSISAIVIKKSAKNELAFCHQEIMNISNRINALEHVLRGYTVEHDVVFCKKIGWFCLGGLGMLFKLYLAHLELKREYYTAFSIGVFVMLLFSKLLVQEGQRLWHDVTMRQHARDLITCKKQVGRLQEKLTWVKALSTGATNISPLKLKIA